VTSHRRGADIAAPVGLGPAHDLSRFDSGKPPLDEWLRLRALKSEGRTARTFVVAEGSAVIGYYCLATGSVDRKAAPGRLRRNAPNQVPVIVLGRLAVDRRWQGRGLGADLLCDAFRRVLAASQEVGIAALLVHAIDDDALRFYMKQAEFIEHPADLRTLFLPIETIADAL
jgi:GNAT superfamily N-acetyltransferase